MIINGKEFSKNIKNNLKEKIENEDLNITLAVVLVGENEASKIYVRNKQTQCKKIGIESKLLKLNENITQKQLNTHIKNLSKDEKITGILLQLPLPKKFDAREAISHISNNKDVDGLKTQNLGALLTGEKTVLPCTPKAILYLAKSVVPNLSGKNVVIVGRSVLVGKPTALLFLNENATVTICHSKTKNLKAYTKKADVLIVAAGKENLIKKSCVKKGAAVIDVGINRNKSGKICGDVDFKKVVKKAGNITPVPGGVGPMTIAMLLQNAVLLKEGQLEKNK